MVVPRLAHVLELEGGFARVWGEALHGTARTAVRKAERSGSPWSGTRPADWCPCSTSSIERSLDRWAAAARAAGARALARSRRDSLRKFELIARTLGEACRIWVAWRDRQPAAAILVLQGTNASYVRGMMDKELAGPTRANYLLHKLAIEEACEAGCRHYDMGETGPSDIAGPVQDPIRRSSAQLRRVPHRTSPVHGPGPAARNVVKRVIGFRD